MLKTKQAVCILTTLGIFAAGTKIQAQDVPAARVFDRILVEGNERFRDGDVLATSGLQTGIPLGQNDLIAAVEALEFTGEFEDVEIRSIGETLIISVEETPEYSGGLTLGLGYDFDTGAFGAVGLSLDDLFDNQTQIRSNLLIAEEAQTLSFLIRSRNFWAQDLRGGVRLSFGNYDYDNTTYDYRFAEIEPFVAIPVAEIGAIELRYTLRSADIRNVSSSASPIIQAEAGDLTSSGVGFSFATGSVFKTEENTGLSSWSLRFDQDFTGLGGDTQFSTSKLSFAGKHAFGDSGFAIRTRIELGAVVGSDDDGPRASERFSLGGASLRGFERGTISPRDVCLGCGSGGADQVTLLGGNYFAVARTDLIVPLLRNAPQVETFAFADFGSAWNVDTNTAAAGSLEDDRVWRSSFGIGASFDTQLGNFEAYLALGTDGEAFDDEQEFGLTFRTRF